MLAELKKQRQGLPFDYEYRIVRPDGDIRWIWDRGFPVTETSGECTRYVGIAQDITDRKNAEAALAEKESQYRLAIQTSTDGYWMTDLQGRFLEVNDAYVRMSGYSREELLTMGILDVKAAETREETVKHAKKIIQDGYAHFESVHRTKEGREWPVEATVTYSPNYDGRFFVFLHDITGRKRIEEARRQSEERYRQMVETSNEGIWALDESCRTTFVNAAICQMLGYSQDQMLGRLVDEFVFEEDIPDHRRQMQERSMGMGSHFERRFRRKEGNECWCVLTATPIKDNLGNFAGSFAMFTDITKEKKSEELIWRQANYDALTGLPNRRMANDRMQEEIKKSHRDGKPVAVFVIDLDRFKEINDSLGHGMGDALLQEAARRMTGCVRKADTIGRLGGDEFVIILGELTDMGGVERIAHSLLAKLAKPYRLGMERVYTSASIGISFYPDDATEVESLLGCADQAMYAAKREGRNRFHYYTTAMQEAADARLRLVNDLHAALKDRQFTLHYQPIVELATGAVRKAEALIRWQHPRLGPVSPADFIPVAEDTGLIVEIGDWVFRQAATQSARWRRTHHAEFQVSVNKSPVQFQHDSDHHAAWQTHLEELGLPGDGIVVEITESLLMDAREKVSRQLLAFRDCGIQIALDDFGTGYSSLSYLQRFDIDYLKIDQSFVQNLAADSNDLALCEAVVVMAHKLGIKVIAEGIETQGQCDLLKQIGCDYGQGFLFSKPLPAEEFEKLLMVG